MAIDDGDAAGGEALARLRQILVVEEGRRSRVYADSRGFASVGIGHLVRPEDRLHVGDVISDTRLDAFFAADGARALEAAKAQAAEADIADADFLVRLAAVNFQLGTGWRSVFPKTWSLILEGDYEGAAEEAGHSLWARQTPRRVAAFQDALRLLAARA